MSQARSQGGGHGVPPPPPISLLCPPPHFANCHDLTFLLGITRGGSRIFERGGGVQARIQDFSSTPPPLDIVRVTSSALRKLKKTPALGHSQAPPLGHCPRHVIRPQRIEKDPRSWTYSQAPPPPLGHCPCDVIHTTGSATAS